MSKEKKNPRPHYWICGACAHKQGGKIPEGNCGTMCSGKCEYCGDENCILTPIVDFKWPGGPEPVWD